MEIKNILSYCVSDMERTVNRISKDPRAKDSNSFLEKKELFNKRIQNIKESDLMKK